MGRRAVTPEQRAKLLESFRSDPAPDTPGSFSRAAVTTGLDRRTCRRAWTTGWPGFRAVREVIETERLLARAALRKEVLAQRLDEAGRLASEDAVEARAQEGKAVRLVQLTAMNALLALHAEKVHDYQRSLARLMQDQDPASRTAIAARRAFNDIASILARLGEAAERGQRMQNVLLGQPTTILGGTVGVHPVAPPNVTTEELVQEIQALQRAAEEARQLEAHEGGSNGNGSLPQ